MAETPLEEEEIRIDAVDGFRGDFAKLCRSHSIRQEVTTADSAKFNGVAERHIAMVESAGIAAQVQARPPFRVFKISSVADCGLMNVIIGRVMHSTVRQLVPMWGINRRSKYAFVR